MLPPPPSALWMLSVFLVQREHLPGLPPASLSPPPCYLTSSFHIIGKCHKIKMRGWFQCGDGRIIPVCLNYFFFLGGKPWLLTIPIIITFHYSIKLSTVYITEVFYFCSVVIIEDECILAVFETRQCPTEEISWNSSGKIPLIELHGTWYSRQRTGFGGWLDHS